MSSESGLKVAPSTATALAEEASRRPASRASSTMRAAAAHVDRVDLAQEGQRLVGAELAGAGHEGADVLGQAAAAEADPGAQELAADAVVVADRLGQLVDVAAGGLADLGHRVDEGDLGGEEGVRGDLDQLGGREVGDHERGALGDRRRVHLAQQLLGPLGRARRPRSGPGAGCPPRRSPRAGTPGSRPARRPRRPGASSASCAASRSAVPTGTVDLPTTRRARSQVRGQRLDGGVDVATCRHAYSPCFCGVPTQTKCTSPNAADLLAGGGEAQPPVELEAALLRSSSSRPGSYIGTPAREQRLDLLRRRRRGRAPRSPARPCTRRGWRRGSRCRSR